MEENPPGAQETNRSQVGAKAVPEAAVIGGVTSEAVGAPCLSRTEKLVIFAVHGLMNGDFFSWCDGLDWRRYIGRVEADCIHWIGRQLLLEP